MHRCLLIPEIIAAIAEEVYAIAIRVNTFQHPCALASLAQTCRLLSEPSLDSLWRLQISLVPLLRTMPADLWKERNGVLHILRPICSADWVRFHTYAARIRHFLPLHGSPGVLAPNAAIFPSPEFLQALASAKPRDILSLCPRVRSLTCTVILSEFAENCTHYMPLFMGASITKVEFNIRRLGPAGLSFVQSMFSLFPGIREVTIFGAPDSSDYASQALFELASQGHSLEVARGIGWLSQHIAEHLAGYKCLKRLEVFINHDLAPPPMRGFSALGEITITSNTLQRIASFVGFMSGSPLSKMVLIQKEDQWEPMELAQIFDTMALHCSHLHLQHLEVIVDMDSEVHHSADAATIESLFALRNLSRLRLMLNTPIRLGNQAVWDMARAWPRLSELVLGRGSWLQGSVTPAGLLHLLRLPDLHTLFISIDASTVDVDLTSDSESMMPPNTNFCDLDLQDSIIHDAGIQPMADLLLKVTPNIQMVLSWDPRISDDILTPTLAEEYRARWNDVYALVFGAEWDAE